MCSIHFPCINRNTSTCSIHFPCINRNTSTCSIHFSCINRTTPLCCIQRGKTLLGKCWLTESVCVMSWGVKGVVWLVLCVCVCAADSNLHQHELPGTLLPWPGGLHLKYYWVSRPAPHHCGYSVLPPVRPCGSVTDGVWEALLWVRVWGLNSAHLVQALAADVIFDCQ